MTLDQFCKALGARIDEANPGTAIMGKQGPVFVWRRDDRYVQYNEGDNGVAFMFLWELHVAGGRSKLGSPFYFKPEEKQLGPLATLANDWLAGRN